ncbi:MAG: DUF2125 domain-containing protein [Salinarimonadaceae bacterium]|nr:MAG: DUF2125 domain-containing protein [Salinarimonadaceae bacterium]
MRTDETPNGAVKGRASRFWLFAPFAIFALVVIGWIAAWFMISDRVASELDGVVAREQALGRDWDCADRRIGGFPFRIEIACASLIVTRGDGASFALGRSRATAQVYQPRHVIFEIAGPMRGGDGSTLVEGDWELLQGSIRGLGRGDEQVSAYALSPHLRAVAPRFAAFGGAPVDASADRLEIHARPSPGLAPEQGALDIVLRAAQSSSPVLDGLTGDVAPADVEIHARVTHLRGLPSGEPRDMAGIWRDRGGRLDLALLDIVKGNARIQLRGELALDALLRPEGRINPSAAGIDDLTGRLFGVERAGGASSFLDILAPRAQAAPGPDAPDQSLRAFPPLLLRDGRVFIGPLPLPQVRLQPVF